MKDKSSNLEMNTHLNPLKQIRKVEAPDYLFSKIEGKIADQGRKIIPMQWVRVAALLAIGIFILELNMLNSSNRSTAKSMDVEMFVYQPNNMLYNE